MSTPTARFACRGKGRERDEAGEERRREERGGPKKRSFNKKEGEDLCAERERREKTKTNIGASFILLNKIKDAPIFY